MAYNSACDVGDDVVRRGAGTARWIQDLPEMPAKNVRFENIAITVTRGARLIDVIGLRDFRSGSRPETFAGKSVA